MPSMAARPRHRGGLRDLTALIRPGQWPKNLVVLVPVLEVVSPAPDTLIRAALAAVLFTIASSLVYVGNDIVDADRDRAHPPNGGGRSRREA